MPRSAPSGPPSARLGLITYPLYPLLTQMTVRINRITPAPELHDKWVDMKFMRHRFRFGLMVKNSILVSHVMWKIAEKSGRTRPLHEIISIDESKKKDRTTMEMETWGNIVLKTLQLRPLQNFPRLSNCCRQTLCNFIVSYIQLNKMEIL